MRIGVWSLAHLHARSYLSVLSQRDDITWLGIVDEADTDAASGEAGEYGAHHVASAEALLGQIDAVIITSANASHHRMALQAAKLGIPTLVEKPLATDRRKALEMIAAFENAGLPLATAFPCPFSPAFIALQDQIAKGVVGQVLALKTTNRGKMPGGFLIKVERSGGGAVIDHTVHVADLLRRLTGSDPVQVYAEIGHSLYHETWDDSGILSIDMASGAIATLDASWSRPASFPTWGDVTLEVIGTRGTAYADLFGQDLVYYPSDQVPPSRVSWGSDLDHLMIDDFVTAVRGGHPPKSTGEDGLRALEVALAAYASAETGHPVEIASLQS